MSDIIKTLGNILSPAPSAAAALVVPDPKTGIPLTGAGSQVYGFANMLSHALTSSPALTGLSDIEAWKQGKPHGDFNTGVGLPAADAVEEAGQRVRQEGDRLLPPQEPTTATERIGQEAVRGAVSMGVPVPGIAKLGKVAETAAHVLMPGAVIGKAGATANALGGMVGAAGAAGNELDKPSDTDPLAGMTLADKPLEVSDSTPVSQPASTSALPAVPQPNPLEGLQLADKPTDLTSLDALAHQSEDAHVSWGQIFQYGAMLGGVVLGHKFLNTALGDRVAAAREARYNDQQTAIDAHTASGSINNAPDIAPPPRDVSPVIPDAVANASLNLRTKFVDKNAGLAAASDFYSPDTNHAELLRAQYGTLLNEGSVARRTLDVMTTGHDGTSQVSMAPLADHFQRITTWDDATRQLYSDARNAANELDNRVVRARDYNATPDTPETRVNFRNSDDAALQAQVAAGYANPDVAYELHAMQTHYVRMTELMQNSGLVDAATASKFIQDHPNYMSSYDTSGTISNPFKARDYTNMSGHDAATTPVWELDAQHFQSVLKQRDQNIAIKAFVENALNYQQQNPRAVKMFTERTDANGDPVRGENSIEYRDNGQTKVYDVASSKLKAMLDQPVTAQSALIRAASQVSSLARSGTTQALASIGGAPFSALNALRTNSRIMIAARPDMYTGMLDRAVGQATGGKLRLRGGLDPTAFFNPVFGTARNVYGGLADARVQFLRGPGTGPGGWARKILRDAYGPAGYDAMVQRAEIVAQRSTRGMMAANGALDSAGMGSREIQTSRLADAKDSYSIANAVAPELFARPGLLGAAQSKLIRLNNLMQEVTSWVGESAQTQHYALNRDNVMLNKKFGPNAETVRTYNTRQSAGDVGQRGSSEAFRNYAAISKYANVAVQDWANISDAFARTPFTAAMNIMTTMGLPALASIYTAMLHGPDAIDHLFNELTDDQRGANIYFYLPGVAAEAAPRIPYSQNERWIVAPMLQFLADAFNLQAHGQNDSTYQWALEGLEDLFSKHITTSTANSALRGLASGTEIMVPDVAQVAMAAATGKRLKVDPVDMIAGGDKPLQQRMTAPLGSSPVTQANVTNDNDANAGAITHKMFWDVVSALFGAVGSGLHQDATMGMQNYKANHDPMEALSTAAQSYVQRTKNSLPIANGTLWNAPMKLSMGTPLSDSVHDAVEKYRPLLTAKSDLVNEGFTRRGGLPLPPPPGSQPKLPTDPTMLQMYFVASKMGEKLISGNGAPMKEVQDYDKLIRALPMSGKKPDAIRDENNMLIRQRNAALQRAAEFINDGNTMLSSIVGKPVDIRKIDWRKGPEQFTSQPQALLSH